MSTQNYAPQNGRPPRPPKFTPQVGVPYQISITALPGRLVASEFGPSEVVFDLGNGRPWYVPQIVADTIYGLRIQPDQMFEIVQGGKAKSTIQVSLIGAASVAETTPAAIAQTSPSQGANYTGQHSNPPAPPARDTPAPGPFRESVPPAPPTLNAATQCMMSAMCSAVDAALETQAYAQRKGLGLTFSEESIRAIGLSIYISACKGGAR